MHRHLSTPAAAPVPSGLEREYAATRPSAIRRRTLDFEVVAEAHVEWTPRHWAPPRSPHPEGR